MAKVKKIVEMEYDDSLHPGNSSDGPGRISSLLFDENNKLKDNASLREMDERELESRYSSPTPTPVRRSQETDPEWLSELAGTLADLAAEWTVQKGIPKLKAWLAPKMAKGVAKVRASVNKTSSITSKKQAERNAEELCCSPSASQFEAASTRYLSDPMSEDARRAFLDAFFAGIIFIRKYNSFVRQFGSDAISGAQLPSPSEILHALEQDNTICLLNSALSTKEFANSGEDVSAVELLLSRELYSAEGAYVPVSKIELQQSLVRLDR